MRKTVVGRAKKDLEKPGSGTSLGGRERRAGYCPGGREGKADVRAGLLVQFQFLRQKEASVTSPAVGTASLQARLRKHRACWGPHFPSQNGPYTWRAPRWRGASPSLCSHPILSLARAPRSPDSSQGPMAPRPPNRSGSARPKLPSWHPQGRCPLKVHLADSLC